MKTQIDVNGAQIEASSIDNFTTNAAVDAVIKDITIQQIAGDINLRSRLQDGKLRLSFSHHFDWGISKLELSPGVPMEEFLKKLTDAGLTADQAKKAADVFGSQQFDIELSEITGLDSELVTEDSRLMIAGSKELKSLDIPLPNIPINLDPHIDVQNLSIKDIRVGGNTVIEARNIGTQPSKLADFSVLTEIPDILTFKTAEVNEAGIKPIEVPRFGLPDLATTIEIPRLGTTEMPFAFESDTGGADIRLLLLDWHPRWRKEICIKIGPYKKCVWIEFGINLVINLNYRWALTLLKVSLVIKNAFLNQISIGLKFTNTVFNKIKIGLLNVLKVLIQHK